MSKNNSLIKNNRELLDSIDYLDLIKLSKDFYRSVIDAIKIGVNLQISEDLE